MLKCQDMPYHIGVKIKLYLSRNGKRLVAVNAGAQRSVYNLLVATNNEIWRLSKAAVCTPVYRERIAHLRQKISSTAEIKNALPYVYGKDVDCQTVENGIRNYRTAWKNRKERHCGVPTFHKKSAGCSYQTNCHYKAGDTGLSDGTVRFLDAHHILLPKLGKVRCSGSPKQIDMLLHHNDDTRIGTITIERDAVGEYWASLQISSVHPFFQKFEKTGSQLGIDMNLLELINGSDGSSYENHRFRKNVESKLAKQQHILSRRYERAKADNRKLSDCRNYQKQRTLVAKLHRQVARQRNDYLNCISRHLVENQDLIAAEDLKVRNMLRNHKLARSIADAGWRTLLTKLQQKAEMYGKTVVLVSPQYTTQTCSSCGHVLEKAERIPLSVRQWDCPCCGTHHMRDINAATVILNKALAQVSA